MFLTRMALDTNRDETRLLLTDPHQLYQEVTSAFHSQHVLWRIDEMYNRTWLVVLSRFRPEAEQLHERYGYLGVFPSWDTQDFDRLLQYAYPGTSWDFDLCATPIGSVDAPASSWEDPAYLSSWLHDQSQAAGFQLLHTETPSIHWQYVQHKWLMLVRWQGYLRVTDDEQLIWTLGTGIGGARELGAGLMTLDWRGNSWGNQGTIPPGPLPKG